MRWSSNAPASSKTSGLFTTVSNVGSGSSAGGRSNVVKQMATGRLVSYCVWYVSRRERLEDFFLFSEQLRILFLSCVTENGTSTKAVVYSTVEAVRYNARCASGGFDRRGKVYWPLLIRGTVIVFPISAGLSESQVYSVVVHRVHII